mmetsp:Transcript_116574/g.249278  ORF Transcript_116574/g.249278 Transcript_116574/m.249278 type:complete len:484 (+) Transcript_116574:48-1499(+)
MMSNAWRKLEEVSSPKAKVRPSYREGMPPSPDGADDLKVHKRRMSDPTRKVSMDDAVCKGGTENADEDAPVKQRSVRRLQTMPSLTSKTHRREGMTVSAQALSRLHSLAEVSHLRKDALPEEITAAQLESAWGKGGSCHVNCLMPKERERPFALRKFQAYPKGGESFLGECGVVAMNAKGCKGQCDSSIGQDACSISRLANGWEVYCVMDGHGEHGEYPSMRTVQTLPYILQTSPSCLTMLKQRRVEAALHHAFEKAETDLETADPDLGLAVAGCTSACFMLGPDRRSVWVATVGDSRVVLLVPGLGVVAQTVDHKVSVEAELKRIEQRGGEVVRTVHEDLFEEVRINIKGEDFPGLCMTRSLGDLLVKGAGVIAEPEVVEWSLKGFSEAYILAASDGIWEFMDSDEVGQFVLEGIRKGTPLDKVGKELLESAQSLWKEKEDDYCDDITLLLLPLRGSGAMARRTSEGCCGAGICRTTGCSTM